MLDVFLVAFLIGSYLVASSLYFTIALVGVGGYFAIKYGIKFLENNGVFDDDKETRYTPPIANTYKAYYGILAVVLVLCAIVII